MEIGYIFDMDGVITDTAEHHYLSWKRVADEEGIPFSRKDNDELRGVTRRQSLDRLLKGREMPEPQKQDMMARKNRYFHELLDQVTPANLLPGVHDLLQEARAAGIRLGIGSASRNVRPICERLSILDWFQAIGDGGSVVNPKPAPDVFIWVAGRMNLNPARCVIFEDAESGVVAALAGGFRVVGIGPQERIGAAHLVRESLDGATIADFAPLLDTDT